MMRTVDRFNGKKRHPVTHLNKGNKEFAVPGIPATMEANNDGIRPLYTVVSRLASSDLAVEGTHGMLSIHQRLAKFDHVLK